MKRIAALISSEKATPVRPAMAARTYVALAAAAALGILLGGIFDAVAAICCSGLLLHNLRSETVGTLVRLLGFGLTLRGIGRVDAIISSFSESTQDVAGAASQRAAIC